MFNRKIQVGLVKSSNADDADTPNESYTEKLNATTFRLRDIARTVAIGVVMYVAADTVRQVTISLVDNYKK